MKKTIIFFLSFVIALQAYSKNYYCDPAGGNMDNDGSKASPWAGLSDVIGAGKSFTEGDTIFLYGGDHGSVTINQWNEDYIVISAYEEETPILSQLIIKGASYWKFIGINISKQAPSSGYNVYNTSAQSFLVWTDSNSEYLEFENCNIYTSGVDVGSWQRLDWFNGTLSGMLIESKYNTINNCTLKNTNFAIEVRGRYTEMTNSVIENFVGDAIRALSSYSLYEYNVVKNSYDITGYDPNTPGYPPGNGNHDDLFQSYTSRVGGIEAVVTDVIVRYNKFISYTDANQVDKSYTQGIACFDGYFNNWIIENNLVVTDSWHGITMLGINNSIITGNTIVSNPIYNDLVLVLSNNQAVDDMTPYIWVGKMKASLGGGVSIGNTIRNNLINKNAGGPTNIIDDGENTIIKNNHTIPTNSEATYFNNYAGFDLTTKSNSPAIDKGINIDLLQYDLEGSPRLMGSYVDCGSYEYDNTALGNNCPVIQPFDDPLLAEINSTNEFTLTATDADQTLMDLLVEGLEPWMSFTDNLDGTGLLTVSPLSEHLGEYVLTLTVKEVYGLENQLSFTVKVIEDLPDNIIKTKENSFSVFPNPVKQGDILTMSAPDLHGRDMVNLNIYDISGKVVFNSLHAVENGTLKFDTASFDNGNGMYIVRIADYKKGSMFYIF